MTQQPPALWRISVTFDNFDHPTLFYAADAVVAQNFLDSSRRMPGLCVTVDDEATNGLRSLPCARLYRI